MSQPTASEVPALRDPEPAYEPRTAVQMSGAHAQTVALVILWLVLTLATGFRWLGESRDYLEYLAYYETIPPYLFTNVSRFEPGFQLLAWLFRNPLDLDYDYLVLVVSGVALGIKFWLFRKYLKYPLLAAATYVAIFFPVHEYTQIRVALALSLAYLSIHQMMERRYVWAGVWFAVSFVFHTSTIVLPLGYFATRLIKGPLALVLLALGGAVLFYFADPLRDLIVQLFSAMNPLLRSYADNLLMETVSLTSINTLLMVAIAASAVVTGWFTLSRYHATFLLLFIGAIVAIAVLAPSPIFATRIRDVLLVSVIFMTYRSRITLKMLPTVGFVWALSGLLFYLAFREGLVFI